MSGYLRKHSKTVGTPPQSMPLDADQVPNSAGGYGYQVDDWKQLERFLILGTEGGTYYVSEKALTFQNVASLEACVKQDGSRVVKLVADISDAGRAAKNEPALFALAYCMAEGDLETRRYAQAMLPKVARIGTHIFHFAQFAQDMRGWGRVLKTAVGDWYKDMPVERMVEQVIKYRQRDGWTHGELLRLAHPRLGDDKTDVARWVLSTEGYQKWGAEELRLPARLQGHVELQSATDVKLAAKLIREHGLTWESVPTDLLKSPEVWEALLERMPMTAMIRNLGRMTSIGLLKPLSAASRMVAERLVNKEALQKARVHPIAILTAGRTYSQGHGDKGSLTWAMVPQVAESLDEAFYLAFQFVEPCNKNFYLALDVSGSMSWRNITGMGFTPREGAAAMAMVTARTEKNYYLRAFSDHLVDVPITTRTSLNDAVQITSVIKMGGTDCGLPMLDAARQRLEVDCFVVYTDSETWAGKVHPKQALDQYRQKMGRGAKLVVVAMEGNKFSLADPKDMGMLDCVGFDTATPQLISQFAR